MYTLIIIVMFSGVAVHSVEFEDKALCESAKQTAVKTKRAVSAVCVRTKYER